MNILEIFTNSILLIITLDNELWDIILLSLFVSFTALIIASLLGFIVGYYFAIYNFYFKKIILIIINSLMGIPPVVVGLIVYFIFLRIFAFIKCTQCSKIILKFNHN